MRVIWFPGITLGAALLLALTMLGLNFAFEAAGSVPDIEGCGFLAGNLLSLLFLYPVAAGVVAGRAALLLVRRFPDAAEEILRVGGRIGFGGAALYFLGGILLAIFRSSASAFPPILWGLLACYTLLSMLGGRAGALLILDRSRVPAWRGGGS